MNEEKKKGNEDLEESGIEKEWRKEGSERMKSNLSITILRLYSLFHHFNMFICIISFFYMTLSSERHSLEAMVIDFLLIPKIVRKRLFTAHMSLLTTHRSLFTAHILAHPYVQHGNMSIWDIFILCLFFMTIVDKSSR
jgi:hypothetical protein